MMKYDQTLAISAAVARTNSLAFTICKDPAYSFLLHNTRCSVDKATTIFTGLIIALALLYFLITYALLLAKLRSYRKQPYTFVQVGLVYNTLQASTLKGLLLTCRL